MSYTLKDARFIRDIDCEARIYEHDKTGAKVVVLPADDTNKAISIAFSTPSENSKGIAHIIEHSVLCGSDKYPLKDPFVQLMKGSMYSFLNAITFSDFTCYPVASTNDTDFKNLAGVYLDAAFSPLLPHKKEVFLQEGHHFELDENGEVVGFNGVVFNEMKGAEGSVDMHIENAVCGALFKGTPYAYESGGLPTEIAKLSYEELCDFYRCHYTASNAYIFLYGDIDEQDMLAYIDNEYLSRYDRTERYVIPEITTDNFDSEVSAPYPADEEDLKKGHYFAYTFAVHTDHTPLNYLTLRVLDRVLCSSQGAYIKSAMQKAGIGEDFYSSVDEITRCPSFGFIAAKCREDERNTFKNIIDDTLLSLAENGIDKERLLSSIRMLEFMEKEFSDDWTPKGITYALQMLARFLYDEGDELKLLEFFDAIDELKKLAETDYFEQFIKTHFIGNPHRTLASVYPDTGFAAREAKQLDEICQEQLKDCDMADVRADFELLNAYRMSEDSEEAAKAIPLLERTDLSEEGEYTATKCIPLETGELLFNEQKTNDIAYIDCLYDLRCLDSELLPYMRIFCELIGAMDTAQHSYQELSDLIDSYSGGITHTAQTVDGSLYGTPLIPFLNWHSRFLYENTDKVWELNKEILLETDFSDTVHMKDMLMQLKTALTRSILESSHITVRSIGLAAYSRRYAVDEVLRGYPCYRLLCRILDDYDNCKNDLVEKMDSIRLALIHNGCSRISYVGEAKFLDRAVDWVNRYNALSDNAVISGKAAYYELPDCSKKETAAYSAPSQVQYAALCGMLPKGAKELRGVAKVVSHLISTDYLWQQVRVLGGAYGCFATIEPNGETAMVSYRDPNLDRTIDIYRKAAAYLQSLNVSERTLRQFIIGAMSKEDKPKTPYLRGLSENYCVIKGSTIEGRNDVRRQLIATDLKAVHAYGKLLQAWIDEATATVIGNEDKIRESAADFTVKTLL